MLESLFAPSSILLVFYLYLLVRWNMVKRKNCYFIGAAGLLLAMLAFVVFPVGDRAWRVLVEAVGTIVAFASAIGACCGEKLPVVDEMQGLKKPEQK